MTKGLAERELVRSKDGSTYQVQRLTEVSEILPRLEPERAYAAYAICQLEPHRFPHTRWYLAQGDSGEALLMYATGSLRGPYLGFGADLFCLGDPAALDVILRLHPGPRFVGIWAQEEHRPVLRRHFRLVHDTPYVLIRWFTPQDPWSAEAPIRRLTGADVGQINRLLRSGSYPRLAFYRRRCIDSGLWHGAFEGDRLVCVDGTEALSPTYGVAITGPALTHPKYRGRGYLKALYYVHIQEIVKGCPLVVGPTHPDNAPMLHIAAVMGMAPTIKVLVPVGFRRLTRGPGSIVRRFLARRQARG